MVKCRLSVRLETRELWRGAKMELTGTVTKVSAMKSLLCQCSTKLPLKWPPVFTAVTPGTMVLLEPCIKVGATTSLPPQQIQPLSSADKNTAQ